MANALARNSYNAMNLPLGDPDIAARNYGVSANNAATQFGRIWNDRATEDGGSKQIYDKMTQWASPEQILARGGNPNDSQWVMMRDALKTGEVDPRLNQNTLTKGMGVGLSETARATQHKSNFLDSTFGKILHAIGTVALGAIPVVGPYAAALAGGINAASRTRPSGLGIAGGVIGGYAGGQTGANIAGGIQAAGGIGPYVSQIGERAGNALGFGSSGGFSNPGALGITGLPGANFSSMPGAFPSTLGATGYGVSGLGMTGANLGVNFASGALSGAPVAGYGPSAIGGDPSSLYTPQSMGPPKPSAIDRGLDAIGNLPGLPSMGAPTQPEGPGAGPAMGGATEIPNATVALPTPGAQTQPGTFEAALTGGGRAPANNLAISGMGAGLLPQARMERVPGYQLRPFANYLMRP